MWAEPVEADAAEAEEEDDQPPGHVRRVAEVSTRFVLFHLSF